MYCRAREWSVMREKNQLAIESYEGLLQGVVHLLERARTASARSVNAIMTSTYWEIGRRIVEYEQKGERRAAYGQAFLARLAADLAGRFGRGFSERNLGKMRLFYLSWKIPPTLTAKSPDAVSTGSGKPPTVSAKSVPIVGINPEASEAESAPSGSPVRFPLPWSHYVRLLSVENPEARAFYEQEALRSGWSARQLIAKFRPSSTTGRSSRVRKPQCSGRDPARPLGTRLRRRRKSRIRWFRNFSG